MKIRKENSSYLITNIFSTDYFYYYSNPALFAAYFFPFIALGKRNLRPYLESEMEEKIENIKANKHGNFYNYASQGFGNVAFYEPYISFEYFYKRLCFYDANKFKYFSKREKIDDMESNLLRDDLRKILSKDKLFLKWKVPVADSVKKELLLDLSNQEVKYVLAKLLFYIVDEKHQLPDVSREAHQFMIGQLNLFSEEKELNVCLGFRKDNESTAEIFRERLMKADYIQILCMNGVSIFGDSFTVNDSGAGLKEFCALMKKNTALNVEVILLRPGSKVNEDESEYQVNHDHLTIPKSELSRHSIENIKKIMEGEGKGRVLLKTTDKSIPYALFLVRFKNNRMDYVKVDLYSPFVENNGDRPSMYIFRNSTPELFEHFCRVFERMWKDDRYSTFIQMT